MVYVISWRRSSRVQSLTQDKLGFIVFREIDVIYAYHIYSGNMKKAGYLGDVRVDWRMILKLMLKKQDGDQED
jgi:hypothetical protein